MLKQLTVLCGSVLLVLVTGLYTYSIAGSEKGAKKCSDNIDNDGDGLIDGDDPDCGGDGGSGGIGVLLDATGATIGKVVSIIGGTEPRVSILLDVMGQTFHARIRSARPASQILEGFEILGNVFFDNANCTGAAWIRPNDAVAGAFFDEFRVAIIIGDNAIDPDERRLYVPTTDVSESRTVNSQMTEKCDLSTQTRDFVPATLLDSDLHITYPKPYTLRLN